MGGKNGQADAVKLGIARAMVEMDEGLRVVMRKHGLLTVDARNKERKKYGQKAARPQVPICKTLIVYCMVCWALSDER